MENIEELIRKNRSYRRFYAEPRPEFWDLKRMVEGARNSASAANLQRIRYALITEPADTDTVFPMLKWAGYLKDWDGPIPEERPTAYLILMTAKTPDVNLAIDIGIAAQSALLTAVGMGWGGCMLRSFDREKLTSFLGREGYEPELVIALGAPKENVVLTEAADGDIHYYRLPDGTHMVPKLPIDDLIL